MGPALPARWMLLLAVASAALVSAVAEPAGPEGEISGTIRYLGVPEWPDRDRDPCAPLARAAAPARRGPHAVSAPLDCRRRRALQTAAGGALRWAVVWIDLPPGTRVAQPSVPRPPPLLDQVDFTFTPRVLALRTGDPLTVASADPELHTVHLRHGTTTIFNLAMPVVRPRVEVRLDQPGIYHATCELHPYMQAHLLVFPHELFAVSDREGRFTIRNVPPGVHRLQLWHERLGTRTATVEVTADTVTYTDLSYP